MRSVRRLAWGLAASVVVLSAAGSPRARADSRADRVLARAARHAEAGHAERAAALLRRLLELRPGHPRATLRLAALQLPQTASGAMAEPEDALPSRARTLTERLKKARDHADEPAVRRRVHRALAWTVALSGDHAQALAHAARAGRTLDAPHAELLQRVAALALRRDDPSTANRALTRARRANPRAAALLADHAAVHLARGRSGDAVRLLRRAVERHPDAIPLRRDLAGALLAAGKAGEAIAVLDEIATQCPETPRCRLDLARAALQAGDTDRAAREARLARKYARDARASPWIVLGLSRSAQGREKAAAHAFREALERDPDHPRARRGLRTLQRGTTQSVVNDAGTKAEGGGGG